MMRRVLFYAVWVPMIMVWGLASLGSAQTDSLPAPRSLKLPKITSVEDLMPYARQYVNNPFRGIYSLMKPTVGVKKGEKVLLLAESTMDPLVLAAVHRALLEAGAQVNVINLYGFPELTHPIDLGVKYIIDLWWPEWVWQAIEGNEVLIAACQLDYVHVIPNSWFKERKLRFVRLPFGAREQLASALVTYPNEIFDALSHKVWSQVRGAKQVRITDPLGTDITVNLDEEYWKTVESQYKRDYDLDFNTPYFPGHITIQPFLSKQPVEGKIVVTALHGGLVPMTTFTVANGRETSIAGSGLHVACALKPGAKHTVTGKPKDDPRVVEYMREVCEKYQSIHFPGSPAPGANFLVEISLGVQPKAFRMPNPEKYSGGARFWGWAEARKRSGVLHIAFGSSTAIFGGGQAIIDFVTEKKIRVQHMDTELYFPTYYVDGKKIVDNGHLLALDDPEIREVAAKYGDPDELLREDWIPKVGE